MKTRTHPGSPSSLLPPSVTFETCKYVSCSSVLEDVILQKCLWDERASGSGGGRQYSWFWLVSLCPSCLEDVPQTISAALCMREASEGLLWSLLLVAYTVHTYQKWKKGKRETCKQRKCRNYNDKRNKWLFKVCLQSEFRMEGSWEVGGRSSWEGKTPRGVWMGFRRHRNPWYYR